MKSLRLATSRMPQEMNLFLLLDTFSHDVKIEALAHVHDGIDDGGIVAIQSNVAQQALIDL